LDRGARLGVELAQLRRQLRVRLGALDHLQLFLVRNVRVERAPELGVQIGRGRDGRRIGLRLRGLGRGRGARRRGGVRVGIIATARRQGQRGRGGQAGDRDTSGFAKLQLLVLCVRGSVSCAAAAPPEPATLPGTNLPGGIQDRLPSGSAGRNSVLSAEKVRAIPGPVERDSNRTVTRPWPAPCTQPKPNSGCTTSDPARQSTTPPAVTPGSAAAPTVSARDSAAGPAEAPEGVLPTVVLTESTELSCSGAMNSGAATGSSVPSGPGSPSAGPATEGAAGTPCPTGPFVSSPGDPLARSRAGDTVSPRSAVSAPGSVESAPSRSNSGNSDSCRIADNPAYPTPTSRTGPRSRGSSAARWAAEVS